MYNTRMSLLSIKNYSMSFKCESGIFKVLNNISLSIGKNKMVALVGESLDKANLTENCSKIVNIKGYSPEFLYYFLKSEYGQKEIAGGAVGEVQAKLPLKNIIEIKVPMLSEPEQEAIVVASKVARK